MDFKTFKEKLIERKISENVISKIWELLNSCNNEYLDFVLNDLVKTKLSIILSNESHYTTDGNILYITESGIEDTCILLHEIGHYIDRYDYSTDILTEYDSLNSILYDEIESNYKDIFNNLVEDLKESLQVKYDIDDVNKYIEYCITTNKIKALEEAVNSKNKSEKSKVKARSIISSYNNRLSEIDMNSKLYDDIKSYLNNSDYLYMSVPVSDALGCKFKLDGLFGHHSREYYNSGYNNLGKEFFANVFASLMCNRPDYLEYIKKYLPRSLEAFMVLINGIKDGSLSWD